jgi:serine/threonine protein kinase/CRP-like cAMP-binding protein
MGCCPSHETSTEGTSAAATATATTTQQQQQQSPRSAVVNTPTDSVAVVAAAASSTTTTAAPQEPTPSVAAAAAATKPSKEATEAIMTEHENKVTFASSATSKNDATPLGFVYALSPAVARMVSGSGSTAEGSTATNKKPLGTKVKHGGGEALHHLRNIFVTPFSFALGATGVMGHMPQYPKTSHETAFLRTALRNHYLFESQPEKSVTKLIAAFEMYTISSNDPRAVQGTDTDIGSNNYFVDVIQQGEPVTDDTAYFYVLYHGRCQFTVDGHVVGWAHPGDSFGELALLYDGPRAATVTAVLEDESATTTTKTEIARSVSSTITNVPPTVSEPAMEESSTGTDQVATTEPTFLDHTVVLFRVQQRSFRLILQQDDQDADRAKMKLVNGVDFLQNVTPQVKAQLAAAMTPFPFAKGDYIVHKGIVDCPWTVIERGTVRAANLDHGYQDFLLHEGQCFGERAIVKDEPAIGDAIAETAGVAFTVDKETFRSLIGNLDNIVLRAQDQAKLKAISVLSDATQSSERVLGFLSKQIMDHTFSSGEVICEEGQPLSHPAALYLVRKGKIRIQKSTPMELEVVEADGFFGDDQLKADMQKCEYISPYTATVVEDCTCGVLKLRDCRNVLNTRRMGKADNVLNFDSLAIGPSVDGKLTMKDLHVHRMIGAGTFGQVFLVSREASDGSKPAYALKVQSKYELCQSGQAKGVVREKNLMALFLNPFVARLIAAFQDDKCVYMLMNLLQGGELYSVMHTDTSNVLSEDHAKFYVACVAEALCYLHCSHALVFRDLKPENVMLDEHGYAILIDFGFCKKITGKTYTTCGTPLYLAPEVILNRGHSWSVDHWSLGVMIYEMLVGHTPFYEPGMTKAELFRNIVRGKVHPPNNASAEALNLLSGLLRRDPTKRLGSLAGSEGDIIEHPWFSGIDRDRLFLKELKAPFIPQIKDPFDSSNFSDWKHVEDKRHAHYPHLSTKDKAIFLDF